MSKVKLTTNHGDIVLQLNAEKAPITVANFIEYVPIITLMVAGAGDTTLPVYIYSMIRQGITPEINAVSSILLVVSRTPGVKVSLAIVQLKPTDVGGKVVALGVGIVSPIPGVSFIINHFASGAVGIEGNIVSLDNGTILKEFYGRNRDPINIFSCNSFEEFACDKYNLDRFARQIAEILEEDPSHS